MARTGDPGGEPRLTAGPVAGLLLEAVIRAARTAGEQLLEVYGSDHQTQTKRDGSPVTEADRRSQEVICAMLAEADPGSPIVAEEAAPPPGLDPEERFWLIDPLDGTKEFICHRGEFTVNIALIESRQAVLGVVFAPALDRLYAAEPGSSFLEGPEGRRPVAARHIPPEGATIVSSRSHGDADALERFQAARRVRDSITIGSSLKFCLLASGAADLYPRFGRTMEWDTAAGHAVLAAAGGQVLDMHGAPLRYGKPGWENPFFLAVGRSGDPGA